MKTASSTTRIELSVRATYVPSWGLYEGARECLQNARDAVVMSGAEMKVSHDGRTQRLTIETIGATIDVRSLLLGYSTKQGDARAAGQYGEGMKLAMLALVRAGHRVTVRSGGTMWSPRIVPSVQFGGEMVLAVDVTEIESIGERTIVEIEGVTSAAWKEISGKFLFLGSPKTIPTMYGRLISDKKYAGMIFVKGIFVQKLDDLQHGYDLESITVDRDRRMVDIHMAKSYCSLIHTSAATKKKSIARTLYAALKRRASDGKIYGTYEGDAVVRAVVSEFDREHGRDTVAVESEEEAQKLASYGVRAVVAPDELRSFIEKKKGTFEDIAQKHAQRPTASYARSVLTPNEKRTLERCEKLVSDACGTRIVASVVVFPSEDTAGRYEPMSGSIHIAKKLLGDLSETLATLVHEAAHKLSGASDGDLRHVATIEEIWKKIFVMTSSEVA